jgi:hypothetical protein
MRSKDKVIKDLVETIKHDERVAAYFFNKAKNSTLFPPLVQEGFFSPLTIVRPVKTEQGHTASFWPQISYLEHVSKLILSDEIKEPYFIETFLSVLRAVVDVQDDFLLGRSLFSCITKVPVKYLKVTDVALMFSWVNPRRVDDTLIEFTVHEGLANLIKFLGSDTHSKNIFELFIKELFTTSEQKTRIGGDSNLKFFTNYGLKHFQDKYFRVEQIYRDQPLVLDIFLKVTNDLLENLLKNNDLDSTSEYWRPAVEDHPQNEYHDSAQSVLVGLLFDVAHFLTSVGKVPVQVGEWRNSAYITFCRLYVALGDVSPHLIPREEVAEKILNIGLDSHSRHEVFHFLKNHFQFLAAKTQNALLENINKIEADYANTAEEKKVFSAWAKMRWIQAIKDVPDVRVSKIRSEIVAVIGDKEIDHPDFSSYMSSGWVGPNSPWDIDAFSRSSIDEIFNILLTFKSTDEFRGPSIDGLSRIFEDYVVADPIKASALVGRADKLNYLHLSSLFDGYTKVWGEKKPVPSDKLLDLALRLSKDGAFVKDLSIEKSKARWVVSSIARFIVSGTKSDEHSFPANLNALANEILTNLIYKTQADSDYIGSSDGYTRAINEPRGKVFEALIILTLRRARLSEKGKKEFLDAWSDLSSVIEPVVKVKNEQEASLFALIGAYYRQFLFLNEKWFFDNFDNIVPDPDKNNRLWVSFMEGFGYVTTYVESVYLKIQERGYFLKFLRFESSDDKKGNRFDRLQNRGIELALISYLLGHETLESGLLATIISDCRAHEWHPVIGSLYSIVGRERKPEHLDKVRLLVQSLIEIRKKNSTQAWVEHFQGADRLLELFANPEDPVVADLLEVVANDRSGHWEFSFVIEFLHKFRESHPKIIADLFLNLLKNSSALPLWPEEKIKDILESLISHDKVIVGEICRIYIDRGFTGEPIKTVCNMLNRI